MVRKRFNSPNHSLWMALLMICIQSTQSCTNNNWFASRSHPLLQKTVEVHSFTDGDETSQWTVVSTRLNGAEELNVMYFVNESRGWAAGKNGALYETADGARTWREVKLESLPNSRITSIFFVTVSLGWVVQRNSYESRIVSTRDGGQSWHLQYSKNSSFINRVRFINEQEGWAVGVKIIDRRVSQTVSSIALHTTDQGKQWVEASSNLNQIALGAEITDLYAIESFEAIILTVEGKVFQTKNGGQIWQQFGELQDERPQTYLSRLGAVETNQVWVLGGADSVEGMWGLLAWRLADGSWKKFRVESYLSDAFVLSKDESFVCGHAKTGDVAYPTNIGLILHSTNMGANWKIVYREQGSSIKALFVINPALIYAINSSGVILRLEHPQANLPASTSN